MKKMFIFIAISMVVIFISTSFLSARKVIDNKPDITSTTLISSSSNVTVTPDVIEPDYSLGESVFYIDGDAVEDLSQIEYSLRNGHFYLDGKTYFGRILNDDSTRQIRGVFFDGSDYTFAGYPGHFWVTPDMSTFYNFDGLYFADFVYDYPELETYPYLIVVFLEVPEIMDVEEASSLALQLETEVRKPSWDIPSTEGSN